MANSVKFFFTTSLQLFFGFPQCHQFQWSNHFSADKTILFFHFLLDLNRYGLQHPAGRRHISFGNRLSDLSFQRFFYFIDCFGHFINVLNLPVNHRPWCMKLNMRRLHSKMVLFIKIIHCRHADNRAGADIKSNYQTVFLAHSNLPFTALFWFFINLLNFPLIEVLCTSARAGSLP